VASELSNPQSLTHAAVDQCGYAHLPRQCRMVAHLCIRVLVIIMRNQNCKSGRARAKICQMFRADFGPAYRLFRKDGHLSPVTVEAIKID